MTSAVEVNFDGLIGPTHNYHTLSWGNTASMANLGQDSSPRAAALEGLRKMKGLYDLGVPQGILPPLPRPCFGPLRQLGFVGTNEDVLRQAGREAPAFLAACSSASAMWAANSATVTPSSDAADGKVHFSAANLISQFHRSLEAEQTATLLRTIFADTGTFQHHAPLPAADLFADEGAANHTRLCLDHGDVGLHLFVFGRDTLNQAPAPRQFPARQTRQASEAICRRHKLAASQVVFAQQNPVAIDAGVFHNDVIATGNRDVFFYHELAYVDTPAVVNSLDEAFAALTGKSLRLLEVKNRELSLDLVVRSYLFNSQIVQALDGRTILLAPRECQRLPEVRGYLDRLLARTDCPFDLVEFVDVSQSMRNGGGPACLRLRVVLTDEQLHKLRGNVLLTEERYEQLRETIERTYPESISLADLSDPAFVKKCQAAVAEVYERLELKDFSRKRLTKLETAGTCNVVKRSPCQG